MIQRPSDLLCEYTENPRGVDVRIPRFSWTLRHAERSRIQSAYQILIARTRERIRSDVGDVWDSGKVESKRSINVEYGGRPLESGTVYWWKVRWWDNTGQVSLYSEIATFETGLLTQDDWNAKWIRGGPLLRTQLRIDRKVHQARAYVSGLGYYELRINGQKVGDHRLDPGWTDYDRLVLYSTYDITGLLRAGQNVVGVMLGKGKYAQDVSPDVSPRRLKMIKQYEDAAPKLVLQMKIEFVDGSETRRLSDETWKASDGPIVKDDVYDGEVYDARREKEGWDRPGYDDSAWEPAQVANPPKGRLVSQATCPPIKAVQEIQPVQISNPKPRVYVYDFGQNVTGWVRLHVSGPRGTEVKLRYAEVLHADGMINQIPNRTAKATDTYILKGEGVESYEPRFTYHGFRFVEVTGFPGTPNLATLTGVVVHSAVALVGGFLCSNSLLNGIHTNVLWGQRGNLMSIPTDCPQRDERMGWMGDAQLTSEEAIYNFAMAAFYTKWIRDIREAQADDGSVPDVVPPFWTHYPADPAWGTACIIIPWDLYRYYGDRRILEDTYRVMTRWVEFVGANSEGGLVKFSKYGDWCPPAHVRPLNTPGPLVSTWCHYQDVVLLSRIAYVLGRPSEAEEYAKQSEWIKEAFNKEFLKEDQYALGSQTAHVLPLYVDMVPEDKKKAVLKTLLEDIEIQRDCHVGTGIVGTRYLLDTLTRYGRSDLAYTLVTKTTYPSWGYMIKEGATTMWERWEYLAGPGMNSHNHIMFGSIDAWFYKTLAGIGVDASAPGFERIIIKPHIVGDLQHVNASVNTIRGVIASSWRRKGRVLFQEVILPVNSEGQVSVPVLGLKNPEVREGDTIVWKNGSYTQGVVGISSAKQEEGYITFEVGSGSYAFRIGEAHEPSS
jgi:alpha-L-rhamnosidase